MTIHAPTLSRIDELRAKFKRSSVALDAITETLALLPELSTEEIRAEAEKIRAEAERTVREEAEARAGQVYASALCAHNLPRFVRADSPTTTAEVLEWASLDRSDFRIRVGYLARDQSAPPVSVTTWRWMQRMAERCVKRGGMLPLTEDEVAAPESDSTTDDEDQNP